MGKLNPIVLIQMLMQYHNYKAARRVFKFTRNNRMRVHRETDEEIASRKSVINERTREIAENELKNLLKKSLQGRAGAVYVDPRMKNIAVPLQMSTSQKGFGILPSGSKIKIPEGKKIRAFTYWEKVNDIDLSCFGLTEDGQQEEFSWRSMWRNQSDAITYSGDETSGYKGGSEYFDIDIERFKKIHPDYRYVVFCDNIYSPTTFDNCVCRAGFMVRDEEDSGEIYEPKTVKTSFKVTGNSSYMYMFAIDLKTREMIWLNMIREGRHAVAGDSEMDFLMDYLNMTDVFNVYDLFSCAGTPVQDVVSADIVVSDEEIDPAILGDKEQIHSYDFEKILKYIQP